MGQWACPSLGMYAPAVSVLQGKREAEQPRVVIVADANGRKLLGLTNSAYQCLHEEETFLGAPQSSPESNWVMHLCWIKVHVNLYRPLEWASGSSQGACRPVEPEHPQ